MSSIYLKSILSLSDNKSRSKIIDEIFVFWSSSFYRLQLLDTTYPVQLGVISYPRRNGL